MPILRSARMWWVERFPDLNRLYIPEIERGQNSLFSGRVDRLGRALKEVELPASVTQVQSLLTWLRLRGESWSRVLVEDAVRVTADRRFSGAGTPISKANESFDRHAPIAMPVRRNTM